MKDKDAILQVRDDPQALEALYRAARAEGRAEAFEAALEACYQEQPDHLLLAAWHYRIAGEQGASAPQVRWKLAAALSAVAGLIFWALSDERLELFDVIPHLVLFWAPISALFVIGYFKQVEPGYARRAKRAAWVLVAVSLFVPLAAWGQDTNHQYDYLNLMAIHLPLMAWIALGVTILRDDASARDRFAFLVKSIEAMGAAGLYLIFGGVFGGITLGMFAALNVDIPDLFVRLIFAGGAGMIPLLSVVTIYDPCRPPGEQSFHHGLSRFLATLLRLLMALSLVVLVIYTVAIPFNFMEPFYQREVLIVYNVMLFALMGLLIGVTPVQPEALSPLLRKWLRRGVLSVAVLGTLISLYALAAIIYRTVEGGITINRLTVIGWNGINIAILIKLLARQLQGGGDAWVDALQQAFSWGMKLYVVWGVFLVLAVPVLFR